MSASHNTYRLFRHVTALLSMGETRFLIDPMYASKGRFPPVPSVIDFRWNPTAEFPEAYPELTNDDILLITHHHFDHFDTLASAKIDKHIRVVTPQNGENRLRRRGFVNISSLRAGQRVTIGKTEIAATPVKHTQRFQRLLYKPGVGYLLSRGGKTVYVSGDTVLFDGLYDSLKGLKIHLAVLYGGGARIPLLGRHTLSHHEAVELTRRIRPDLTIVTHLDCLNHCREEGFRLEALLKDLPGGTPIRIPEPGIDYSF